MGPYGCGKSQVCFFWIFWFRRSLNGQQFIDCLTQQTNWATHGLVPQNHPVRSIETKMRDSKSSVILVDTPGFDDYTTNAEDILEDVKHWLQNKQVYDK